MSVSKGVSERDGGDLGVLVGGPEKGFAIVGSGGHATLRNPNLGSFGAFTLAYKLPGDAPGLAVPDQPDAAVHQTRSPVRASSQCSAGTRAAHVDACVRIAPFGAPVVPEV